MGLLFVAENGLQGLGDPAPVAGIQEALRMESAAGHGSAAVWVTGPIRTSLATSGLRCR